MEILYNYFDFFIHLDVHLSEIIRDFGLWTYASLFIIFFMETGFVVAHFLPGVSLVFAAGTFSALGLIAPVLLFVLLRIASILGDAIIYSIGRANGDLVFGKNYPFFDNPSVGIPLTSVSL